METGDLDLIRNEDIYRKLLPVNEAKVNIVNHNLNEMDNKYNNNNDTNINCNNNNYNNNNNDTSINNNYQFRNTFLSEVTFSEMNNYHENEDTRKPNKRNQTNIYLSRDVDHSSNKSKESLSDEDSLFSTSTSTAGNNKKKPNIPDGGYGWVIVGISFVISLIVDGMAFSFGLIYDQLLKHFKESPSKTAWVGALFLSVPLLSGPILSNLVDKYGCRNMTIIGGFLAALGFALASKCDSIEMLLLTFGLLAGIGIGISYVTAVVSVAFWFDKRSNYS